MFGMGGAPIDEDPRPIKPATVRRVVATFGPYRRKVTFVGLMIVITAGLGVVNPLLIVRVFDNALFGTQQRLRRAAVSRTCRCSTSTWPS